MAARSSKNKNKIRKKLIKNNTCLLYDIGSPK